MSKPNDNNHFTVSRRAALAGIGVSTFPLLLPPLAAAQVSPSQPAPIQTPPPPAPRPSDIPALPSLQSASTPSPNVRRAPLHINDGARRIDDRAQFEHLARHDIVPGGIGAREVKFVISKVNKSAPQLYFMNTNTHEYHYEFATLVLNVRATNDAFNRVTYFSSNRLFLAGSIIAYDNFEGEDGAKGLYAIEFWPTDPVGEKMVGLAYDLIEDALNIDGMKLAYHASGGVQETIWKREREEFRARGIPVVTTDDIYNNVSYSPLNIGTAIGRVRFVDGSKSRPLTATDIAVFKHLPNDLTRIAGVISESPQTPLSHVNLRARQNGIPNAYLKNALSNSELLALENKIVRLDVTAEGWAIRAATQVELTKFTDEARPAHTRILGRDLSRQMIADLRNVRHADYISIGAKAANVAELLRLLGGKTVPNGFAVPFYFYDRFMQENGFYKVIDELRATSAFQTDAAFRVRSLKTIRAMIKTGPMPELLRAPLTELQEKFTQAGHIPRCRSSANSEDLIGFTGAGLYDSFTHRPHEGHIEKSIKQVWASLWNFRAYEEREFYRIDHSKAAMGVLVHTNYDDEKVNGVAITKNIYFPKLQGFYINSQIGEHLVTNPDGGAIPEELLIVEDLDEREVLQFEKVTIRRSNLVPEGALVLTSQNLQKLVNKMGRIQSHFKNIYKPEDPDKFAMEIEFKVTKNNQLIIKQARPWV